MGSNGAAIELSGVRLQEVADAVWEIDAQARHDMRVPARVFADRELLEAIGDDSSLEQLQNVATLPGIVDAALAMPDVHQGYGFPVGGLAATELPDGVISPGGVGYDINCGVRLLAVPFTASELGEQGREALTHEISRLIPAGAGREGSIELDPAGLERVLVEGAAAMVDSHGFGTDADVEHTESQGRIDGADPDEVSERARKRGATQLGTMGGGNHFIELQEVERIDDTGAAAAFGLREGQVTALIHSGSRGLGHQVCTDHVKRMDSALDRHRIELPDRQLACAPLSSSEGQAYLGAMACAANFAFANRQTMAHRIRTAVERVAGAGAAGETRQVYDVAHNIAKLETHGGRDLCVHRKGSTRSLPPGSEDLPADYAEVGQPVFIPGSMGTASFVLAGRPGSLERSFGSCCHGAGRRMSRTGARRQVEGGELRKQLEGEGIVVRSGSAKGLAEEAPLAYKDVDRVVEVVERAGLAAAVVRLRPIGVIKG